MKKYILLFLLLCATASIYVLLPAKKTDDFASLSKNRFSDDDFVSMGDHSFKLKGKDFFPLAVNYMAAMQTDGKEYWARPAIDYSRDTSKVNMTKEACLRELRADMILIRKMGFNSVRVVGFSEVSLADDSNKFSALEARLFVGSDKFIAQSLSDSTIDQKYFDALAQLFKEANDAGLKIILAVRTRPEVLTTEIFLDRITKYFRNDATLMAYDLFNEPLYFDKPERNKKEIHEVTRKWKRLCHRNAPRQLVTIGLSGIREVHAWDPTTIDVDFVSFHPYEHEPEQVRNELTWYNRFVKKPWIIGETAIPADNDSVPYEDQKLFAEKTLTQAHNCGAWGYTWWQYKDVHWPKFHSSFMGVTNWKGETILPGDNLVVYGTVKPVAEAFQKFNPSAPKGECICLSNYYNYSKHRDFSVKGKLVDDKNNPIEGGIIVAWDKTWKDLYHTISKADGSFELFGNFPFYHWMASANAYTMVRGESLPSIAKRDSNGTLTIDLGNLKIIKLSFED